MDDLKTIVRGPLAPTIRDLWDSIEEATGLSINVRLIRENEAPDPAVRAGLDPKVDRATLLVKEAGNTPDASILHELLHLQRYWIDAVPQMVGIDPRAKGVVNLRENSLEHLVIVPKQAELGFADQEFWDEGARQEWEDHEWPTHPLAIRRKAFMGWLRTHIVCSPDVVSAASATLDKLGLFDQAQDFKNHAVSLLDDKPRLVAFVLEAFEIDHRKIRLFYFRDGGRIETIPR